MVIDVLGAIIASVSLLFVIIPNTRIKGEPHNILKDMREGGNVILRNKGVKCLMVSEVVVCFFVMPIVAVMPLMTLQYFSGTPYQVGLIETLFGLGLLVCGIILGVWNPKLKKVGLLISGYFILGLSIAFCGMLSPSQFLAYSILTVIQGLSVPLYTISFTALLQTQFSVSHLGRIFAIFGSVSQLPSIVGLLLTGFIADELGVENIFLFGGIAVSFIAGLLLFSSSVKRCE